MKGIGPQHLRAIHELIASPLQFTRPMTDAEYKRALRRQEKRATRDPEKFATAVIAVARFKARQFFAARRRAGTPGNAPAP